MLATTSKLFGSRIFGTRFINTFLKHVKHDEKKHRFLSVFPEVVDSVTTTGLLVNVPLMSQHFAKVLEYNVLKEKRFRPSIILNAYATLEEPNCLTEENLHLANILAWCLELIQTSIIINDDIMDCSQKRGNEISWYLKENVGQNAINDAMFVLEASFMLLDKYFSERDVYKPLQSLFRYMNSRAAIGQGMDWKCNINGKPNYDFFNFQTYNSIIRNKGCAPFVEGPFKAGLILSKHYNSETLNQIMDVVIKLGHSFQIDNDVLDVFNNGDVRNEIGSDIREGKCSWLAVQVLENGSKEQVEIFKKNYGQQKPENEWKVIEVYLQMNLFEKYLEHKNETLEFVNRRMKTMTKPSLRQATLNLAENIFP